MGAMAVASGGPGASDAPDASGAAAPAAAQRLARAVTEVLAPAIWAAVLPVVVAVHAAGWAAGLAWGALATSFSAVIPYAVVWFGVRRGHLTDHHIGRREQRRTPLLLGLVSVAVGLFVLVATGAPDQLTALVVVGFVVGLGVTVANQYWKLSVHGAVAASSVTILVMTFGPVLLAGALLVALTGWSRIALRHHTAAQVLAGTAAGIALAAITFGLLT